MNIAREERDYFFVAVSFMKSGLKNSINRTATIYGFSSLLEKHPWVVSQSYKFLILG